MSQVEDLRFHFFLPNANSSEHDSSIDMRSAFEMVVKYGGNAQWVKPGFSKTYKPSSSDVVVFQSFEGNDFEYLKENSAKILGPRCMLTSISEGRSIPSGPSPILSEGMRGIIACCSGFSAVEKKEIETKIQFMGGYVDKKLRAATTHIVALNNLSSKAIAGYDNKITIMKKEWVDAVYEKSLECNINGADEEFKRFIAPLFNNLTITTSGIPKKEKEKIRNLITNNGGTFTGELVENRSNLVILLKPEGEKYKYAKAWNITCIKPAWLYACVKEQKIVPLATYVIDAAKPKCSTPKKDNITNVTADFSMVSNIGHVNDRQLTHLDETYASFSTSEFQAPMPVASLHKENKPAYSTIIDDIMKDVRVSGPFLDGCNIFLFGFNSEYLEKLKKIINLSGATRFDELSKSVTYVLVGSANNMDADVLRSSGAAVVSCQWLAESMKLQNPAPSGKFLLLETVTDPTEPPSPLSKQGAQMLSRSEKSISQPNFNLEEEPPRGREELLERYNQSHQGEPLKQPEALQPPSRSSTFKSESTAAEDFFAGLKFYLSQQLTEEEAKQLEEVIVEKGGQIVPKRYSGVPDYAVVAILGAKLTDVTTKEVINAFFMKDCCLQGSLVPIQYYHQPVTLYEGATPLNNCVITVSNYVNCEREFLELLIECLGAVPQSLLARKAKDSNILKSTHLICATPTGQKYSGALRWGLPVVHHEWLIKCASMGTRVSEQPYLIGESKLSTTSSSFMSTRTPVSVNSISRLPVSTPKDQAVNKAIAKLKEMDTPKSAGSPDMNRTVTPTSPYGAFYGNDNPSPGTRKRLLKWANQGVEFPQAPTSRLEERRRDSTPLSELLSRQLNMMKRKPDDAFDSPLGIPTKRPALNLTDGCEELDKSSEPVRQLDKSGSSNELDILAGLQRLKELGENFKKSVREDTPSPSVKSCEASRKTAYGAAVVVEESQPHTEVGWEYPVEREGPLTLIDNRGDVPFSSKSRDVSHNEASRSHQEKIFMLSGFSDMDDAKQLIEDSGGKVSSLAHFDKTATHLVTPNMTRGEKLMGSIASGIWVLHPTYLDELRLVRDVYQVEEDKYEWGNPSSKIDLTQLSVNGKECAQSSYMWRRDIQSGMALPFQGMKIILLINKSKQDSFQRLLEAGGGKIFTKLPPLTSGPVDSTMCISDLSTKDKLDFELLAKCGICCVNQLFISDHILKKSDAKEKNLLPGFSKVWRHKNCS